MSAVFGLGAFLSDESGKPTLADQVQTRADRLGSQMADSFDAAKNNIDTIALMVVSDWASCEPSARRSTTSGRFPRRTARS
jgi:hypothetical protein